MRKILIFLLLILCVSCKSEIKDSSVKIKENSDRTLFYYNSSLSHNNSIFQKHDAINKSLFFAKITNNDTLITKVLYQKSLIHYLQAEYDSLLFFSDSIINYSSRNKITSHLARQYYLKAYYFDKVAHIPDSAFVNYNSSKNHFQFIKDRSWVGKNFLAMGIIQKNQGDFFGSKETITEALEYLNPEKDQNYIASSYSGLATNHRKLLNYEDAIKFYKKALALSNSKSDMLIIKNNLSATLIDNKQYTKAIKLLEGILSDSIIKKQSSQFARISDNLAYAEWLSDENKGEKKLIEALKIRVKNNDKRGQIASYTHLGEFYSKNNPKIAIAYFDSVIQLSKIVKNPRAEKDAMKYLMGLEPKNIRFKDRYVFLQDSLHTQELKVKTQFAKYKYNDKLKQESILRLQKEKAEEKLKTTKQRNQKIVYFFVVLLLLILSSFTFYFFTQRAKRLKQLNKTAKLEATYETEAEFSRKLHDDFGGKINQAMIMIQNNTEKPIILDTLEGLYNQSRDFSREINEIETGLNYTNELFEMLRLNTPQKVKLYITENKDVDWSSINSLGKTVLYKVLRELMINMKKYSQATVVTISFKNASKHIKINYSDNGVGASEMEMNTKNGLRNTEKRIQAIGGTIIFETEKGKGFKAEIKTPT